METSPNTTKRRKDVVQSECPIPEEEGLADALSNSDPNANWGTEPNFNLNLTLTSPSNPRLLAETSKLHGGNKKDDGNKGGGAKGATETGKMASTLMSPVMSPGEDPSQQKSRIPALSRSPTAEALVNSRGDQRLKSPNPKRTLTASPKPHRVEQTSIASSPRTTERVKIQVQKAEPAGVSNPKPTTTKATNKITVSPKMQTTRKEISLEIQSPKTLHLPVSPNIHNQKGDSNVISPKLTNRTPTMTAKIQKPDPASTRHDSRTLSSDTPPVGPKSQNQRADMALLSPKTPQQSSLSPKPSTQRKASGTRNTSGSKEDLDGKDSSVGSGSKSSSKSSSNSKATTAAKDSLDSKTGTDSKASPNSKTAMGSKDSLDSKSGSASKTSWGSKDSLDSKTGSNSKASPNCKSGMGSRDSLDARTATEIKASKTGPDSKTVVGLKPGMGSKDDLDPKTPSDSKASFNLKTSPSFKTGSELNLSSHVLSSPKPGPTRSTSKPSLVASCSKIDLVGSISPLSSRTGLCGSKDNNLKATGSSAKPGSDSSKTGPVRSSSKSALADLSPSLTLSPRPSPASRSPGSGPGKTLGSSPAGQNKEVQRSPGSAPGNYIHCIFFKNLPIPKHITMLLACQSVCFLTCIYLQVLG